MIIIIGVSLNLNLAFSYYSPARFSLGSSSGTEKAAQSVSWNLQKASGNAAVSSSRTRDVDTYECQTCKNRKYKDGSDDLGVSFKTPTHVDPERAAYAIRAHENEHVAHAKAEAAKDDNKEIVSQSVVYHTAVCPECGRTYMSGGTTRTTFRTSEEPVQKGRFLDLVA